MKKLIIAVAYLAVAPVSKAQVSCSALVPVHTCKMVSELANLSLSHMLKYPVPMEVLTPDEYNKRKGEIRKADDSTGRVFCGSACSPKNMTGEKLQEFYNAWDEDVMFTRARGELSNFPTKIIVSTDEFEDMLFNERDCPCTGTKNEDGKHTVKNKYGVVVIKEGVFVMTGKLSIEKIEEAISFIVGYFTGLLSMGASNDEIMKTN